MHLPNNKSRYLHTSKCAYAPKPQLIYTNDSAQLPQQPTIKRDSNESSLAPSELSLRRGCDEKIQSPSRAPSVGTRRNNKKYLIDTIIRGCHLLKIRTILYVLYNLI